MQETGCLRPEILVTNDVPSPQECDLIRKSLIPSYVERCLALDAEVDRAEAALAAVQRERRAQYELLNAHTAALSPMRRMVPDVLLEIFHHCHSQSLEAPMRLGGVCRTWRELVLSTPTLWTRVFLHDSMPHHRIVPFARSCALYSGSSPIKVVLRFVHFQRHSILDQVLSEALEILVCHIHRWYAFEASMDSHSMRVASLKIPENGPLIESLVLTNLPCPASLLFSSLPRLRHLRVPPGIVPQDIPLLTRSTQLRSLCIGGMAGSGVTLMECWIILSNCLEIEVFDIRAIKLDLTVIPQEEITLSRLRELRLGPHLPDPAPLIQCIKTPVLQGLRLIGTRTIDSNCVQRLVRDCRPPLTSLSLANTDGGGVADCLLFLPDLESLILQNTSAMDVVITRLTDKDSDGGLVCPKLVHLGLRLCFFTGNLLLRLASVRRRAAGGLRVFVDRKSPYRYGDFQGLAIELSLVEELTSSELEELYSMQTEYEL